MPGIEVGWISPTDARWSAALDVCDHDIYQVPSYCLAATAADGAPGGAVLVERGRQFVLLPAVRLPWPDGRNWDLASPYGYPSFAMSEGLELSEVQLLFRSAWRSLRAMGCVTAFIRGNPLMPGADDAVAALPSLERQSSTPTVKIPLLAPRETIWSNFRSGHRNEIRRASRSGFVTERDQDFSYLPAFVELYQKRMNEVGAADYYQFDDRYFRLLRQLGPALSLIVCRAGDEVMAGSLFLREGSRVNYHLAASRVDRAAVGAMKSVLSFAADEFREEGAEVLHLGGGRGGRQDSLFTFKAGFGPGRASFRTFGFVTSPGAYHQRLESSGVVADDYFPSYRRSA